MFTNIFLKTADHTNNKSLAFKLRKERFKLFEEFASRFNNPKILDVGGTQSFWSKANFSKEKESHIVLSNLEPTETTSANFISHVGDATNMKEFEDNSFDIIFSNSVIEHVGDFGKQKDMADEIRRLGKAYFVQTPNKYFPIEPHFLFPFFQFLPKLFKIFLIMHFRLGWFKKEPNKQKASKLSSSIRLLSKKELRLLFPEGKISEEKFLFLTKSYTVYSQ